MSKCNRCGHICHCGLGDDHKVVLGCDCIGCDCGVVVDDTNECEACQ